MRKKFDIKYRPQIESGEYKVETRDGKRVRILCYDANNIVPIVALVTFDDGSEGARDYYLNGSMNFDRENALDLFVVTPEEELSEFEKAFLERVFHQKAEDLDEENKEIFLEDARYVLALARKELEPEVLKRLDEAYKNQDEVVYENGKRDGKVEAMKDLPRWKKAAQAFGNYTVAPTEIGEYCLLIDGRFIMLSELMNLPGFKED